MHQWLLSRALSFGSNSKIYRWRFSGHGLQPCVVLYFFLSLRVSILWFCYNSIKACVCFEAQSKNIRAKSEKKIQFAKNSVFESFLSSITEGGAIRYYSYDVRNLIHRTYMGNSCHCLTRKKYNWLYSFYQFQNDILTSCYSREIL